MVTIIHNVTTGDDNLGLGRACGDIILSHEWNTCENINIQFLNDKGVQMELVGLACERAMDLTDHVQGGYAVSLASHL
jgi:hypothetical protein